MAAELPVATMVWPVVGVPVTVTPSMAVAEIVPVPVTPRLAPDPTSIAAVVLVPPAIPVNVGEHVDPRVQVAPATVTEAFASAELGIAEADTLSVGTVVEVATLGTSHVGQLAELAMKLVTVPPPELDPVKVQVVPVQLPAPLLNENVYAPAVPLIDNTALESFEFNCVWMLEVGSTKTIVAGDTPSMVRPLTDVVVEPRAILVEPKVKVAVEDAFKFSWLCMEDVGSTNPIVVGDTPSIVRPVMAVVVDSAAIGVEPI